MKVSTNAQSERNAAIMRQRQLGKDTSTIAAEFGVTRARICQIVKRLLLQQHRHAALVDKYGARPNIAWLPDSTPIEVLTLCDANIQGWAKRLRHLKYAQPRPIGTLGDLRRVSDEELRSVQCIGAKMARELRRFCPFQRAAEQ
jgi:hypothetical protein